MTIEEQVTGGLTRWLEEFEHDPERGRVEFRAIVPGAVDVAPRRVTFTEVREYAEEPFDPAVPRDPTLLECLIGLDAHERGLATSYVIHTTEREVTFYTDVSPKVEVLGAAVQGESGPPAA